MALSSNDTKKILSVAGLYLAFFALGSFLPFYVAKRTADGEIEAACKEHKDLCDSWCNDVGQVESLEKVIGPIDNTELFVGMVFSALIASCLSSIPHFCLDRKSAGAQAARGGPRLSTSGGGCMGKLRTFKDYVLPTPYDAMKLCSSVFLFSLANIIVLLTMAYDISGEVCDDFEPAVGYNETDFDDACLYLGKTPRPCALTYPQASESDAKMMAKIAGNVQASMLGIGIPLILIAGVTVTLAALSVVTCVKACISRNQNAIFARRFAQTTGINDEGNGFAMDAPGGGGGYDPL